MAENRIESFAFEQTCKLGIKHTISSQFNHFAALIAFLKYCVNSLNGGISLYSIKYCEKCFRSL